MEIKRGVFTGRVLMLSAALLTINGVSSLSAGAQAAPAVSRAVPAFTLKDAEGKARTLQAFRGRPVILYFFCPCADCHRVAEMWGQAQRGMAGAAGLAGANSKTPADAAAKAKSAAKAPVTLVAFAGEAAEAEAFRAETGMDAAQTVLLADSDSKVAQTYDAIPCPRVFVLDAGGILRYTNLNPDAKIRVIEPATVVSRVLDALRALTKRSAVPLKPGRQHSAGDKKRP